MNDEVKAALREKIINELQHYDITEHGLPLFGDLRTTWERVADRALETLQPEIERLLLAERIKGRMDECHYVRKYLHFDANQPSHVNYMSRRPYELQDLTHPKQQREKQ